MSSLTSCSGRYRATTLFVRHALVPKWPSVAHVMPTHPPKDAVCDHHTSALCSFQKEGQKTESPILAKVGHPNFGQSRSIKVDQSRSNKDGQSRYQPIVPSVKVTSADAYQRSRSSCPDGADGSGAQRAEVPSDKAQHWSVSEVRNQGDSRNWQRDCHAENESSELV